MVITSIKKTDIFGYQWNFAELEFGSAGNYALYSDKHGLLSIGGARRNCNFKLDFGKFVQEHKPKWDQMPGMLKNRGRVSCCLINTISKNNDYNTEKLIVVNGADNDNGGDYLNTMEIYDFNDEEWRELKQSNFCRECAGICYDENLNCIYVGGGVCDFTSKYAQNKLEYYDCYKLDWFELNDLKMDHSYYPIMWKNIKNNKLLYIASCSSNTLELYDLRNGKTYIQQNDLSKLLDTKMTKYSRMNRLLRY